MDTPQESPKKKVKSPHLASLLIAAVTALGPSIFTYLSARSDSADAKTREDVSYEALAQTVNRLQTAAEAQGEAIAKLQGEFDVFMEKSSEIQKQSDATTVHTTVHVSKKPPHAPDHSEVLPVDESPVEQMDQADEKPSHYKKASLPSRLDEVMQVMQKK